MVLMVQADMFDPTNPAPTFADYYGFQPIVRTIAREAAGFDGPVYLFNGDSHVANVDEPLAAGSPWVDLYGVAPVDNLTRITLDGSTNADSYLRVSVQPRGREVLTWAEMPFAG